LNLGNKTLLKVVIITLRRERRYRQGWCKIKTLCHFTILHRARSANQM